MKLKKEEFDLEKEIFNNLVNKRVTIFTEHRFKYNGIVKAYGPRFIKIYDEMVNSTKLIRILDITEIDIKDDI